MRDLHKLAAYRAILLVGVHLGLKWTIVMNVVRSTLGLTRPNRLRTALLRTVAIVVSAKGSLSAIEIAFGPKLINQVTLDMWDFTTQTPQFIFDYLSIIGLFAVASYYASRLVPVRRAAAGA